MHEALKGLTPLTYDSASKLQNQGERWFATTFLAWFNRWPNLYYEPFKVMVPSVGHTFPDFATEFSGRDMVLYEVTITRDTSKKQRKLQQQKIYRQYTATRNHVLAVEINGGALRCPDTTMEILEDMYRGRRNITQVQEIINSLGRDSQFFQSTLIREMGKI